MENYYIAALTAADAIGAKRARQLIEYFGSAKAVWEAEGGDLEKSGVPSSAINSLLVLRKNNPDCPEKIFDHCKDKNIKLCGFNDEDYPKILKETSNAPALFYYKGTLKAETARVAIVGSRLTTNYGQAVAINLARDIAKTGVTIVSGAARGIDTFAHRGALKSGRTVAVLGCGIDICYPLENKRLLEEIISTGGAVISEYHPQMTPMSGLFPQRNRIIAGLSLGVVVVEAGDRSGALNTAQHAGDYGRLVFAVPCSIYSERSRGCHALIRDGAILVRDANDILEDCNLQRTSAKAPDKSELEPLDEIEKAVLAEISSTEAKEAEDIAANLDENISMPEISSALLTLEMKGYIETDDAGGYIRTLGI